MTTDKIEKNCLVSPRKMIVNLTLSAQGRDSNPVPQDSRPNAVLERALHHVGAWCCQVL